MITRVDIINYLISMTNAQYYLEIGSGHHVGFKDIECNSKHDIEPNPGPGITPTYKMVSDKAFSMMDPNVMYDIIFIDGLHLCEQLAKDVYNSSQHLNPYGFIVIHDCLPEKEIEQSRQFPGGSWTGDVWKFQAWMVKHYDKVWTIPENWGCGIIWNITDFKIMDQMPLPSIEELLEFDWNIYMRNWPWMLRVVDWEIFKKIIPVLWNDLDYHIDP